jgi:hypothetical protein
MEKVTGIGGVFFKARDPDKMTAWYQEHLGIEAKEGAADFAWRECTKFDRTWLIPTRSDVANDEAP